MELKMVSHPARSQKSPEAAIRRLLSKYDLRGINLYIGGTVVARAMPHSWHPEVKRRRDEALAELGENATLAQLSGITSQLEDEVARASAPTLDAAIEALARELARSQPEPAPQITPEDRDRAVHMAHCNQGQYEGSCKYGDDSTCPALQQP